MNPIRNFCIIAHIDHGKSTLADRLLEVTGTIEKRKMKAQFLDQLELERERGITIKMAPVRMTYRPTTNDARLESENVFRSLSVVGHELSNSEYILNLIDTPGHPDFGYEVSRALAAVEGAILLVDGTQGIQAQTLSNYYAAKKAGLTIIGAVNKIDMALPDIDRSILETAQLLGVDPSAIHRISGKTGEGVEGLLEDVVRLVPPPKKELGGALTSPSGAAGGRALIFDSFYDDHKGIIAAVRVFNGSLTKEEPAEFLAVGERIKLKEVGFFKPTMKESPVLGEGEIGYVVTGLKDPQKIKIGDTIIAKAKVHGAAARKWALPGYKEPNPVVFVSFFPDDADEFDDLKKSLERLKLNDSSFAFEPDTNEVLGRGFKGGFLGKLHFEIVSQRLEKEFNVRTVTSFPSVAYRVKTSSKKAEQMDRDAEGYVAINNPKDLPEEYEAIVEPMIRIEIVTPNEALGSVLQLQEMFRWRDVITENLADRLIVCARMPLAELISDFDDKLKSVSGGFASFSYEEDGWQTSDLVKLDIMVANESVSGLSRILPRATVEREGRAMALRLKEVLPQQQFPQAIQARALGRIIARETIPALRKDVTGYLYGGDRTRKMKLWKKQKRGKKKLLSMAKVHIAPEDFKRLIAK